MRRVTSIVYGVQLIPVNNTLNMILNITLLPKSSMNKIVEKKGDSWRVKVTAAPVDGKANEALIKLISKELKVAKSTVIIKGGVTSKRKVIEIIH